MEKYVLVSLCIRGLTQRMDLFLRGLDDDDSS